MTIGRNNIGDAKIQELWWQKRGLMFTASGYGKNIPSTFMIKLKSNHRWYRVYSIGYSNCSTMYIKRGKCPTNQNFLTENIIDLDDVRDIVAESAI